MNKYYQRLTKIDVLREDSSGSLDTIRKKLFSQYFTPAPIAHFMASLFDYTKGPINLLDAGCGNGTLFSAFTNEVFKNDRNIKIHADLYEIDDSLIHLIEQNISESQLSGDVQAKIINTDFINDAVMRLDSENLFTHINRQYTHAILNPPYGKISTKSDYRKILKRVQLNTGNLYSAFVALAIKLLSPGGQLVAIIPRSFCNGPYFKSFREFLLSEVGIHQIHVFQARNKAFSDDAVLQENIIIHCSKGEQPKKLKISASPSAEYDFNIDEQSVDLRDLTTRIVPFSSLVHPNDPHRFIHIVPDHTDQLIKDRMDVFTSTLEELEIQVSTGPVVDFRLKAHLLDNIEESAAPLLYPKHINGGINWPRSNVRANAIIVNEETKGWLYPNNGCYILTRRFTSKEEKKRIVASLYPANLPGQLIGFDNMLNVFHYKKAGLQVALAKGLWLYLNSTLFDKLFRQFSGHTQVNATDLRNMHYPSTETLVRMGQNISEQLPDQGSIDQILNKEIKMSGKTDGTDPLLIENRISEALQILTLLGLPKAQQNERSALTLLALLDLTPENSWTMIKNPQIGVTPIMDWCAENYGKQYAPNSRETFRRFTLHQFVDAGIVQYNPDQPDRPVNSPHACYQVSDHLSELLYSFRTADWDSNLEEFLSINSTLAAKYAKERKGRMIACKLPDGTHIDLSAGKHSQLIADIIESFGARYAPGAKVLYIGDTGKKERLVDTNQIAELGLEYSKHSKMPDVVLFSEEKNWLFLVEAVTSHGPVDPKRYEELDHLFKDTSAGIVYVTAFPNMTIWKKYSSEISWETEVWVADNPTHLIHFNGDRFLGPYPSD